MKRGKKIQFLLFVSLMFVLSVGIVSAECNLQATMINQDPYPAIPGEYVKVVFQLSDVSEFDCGIITFEVLEGYPFSLDPGTINKKTVGSGIFVSDFESFLLVPYKIRVDEKALDGENPLKIKYTSNGPGGYAEITKEFDIEVDNPLADFEVHVSDYASDTRRFIIDILNVGENDIEALTVEIPEQETISIIGNNKAIIGELDSNEEDIASFEAFPKEGNINLIIRYTDQIGVRRSVEKTVYFNPELFKKIQEDKNGLSVTNSFIIGFLIPVIFFIIRGYLKKRKKKHKR